jgi:hypothetical protein
VRKDPSKVLAQGYWLNGVKFSTVNLFIFQHLNINIEGMWK